MSAREMGREEVPRDQFALPDGDVGDLVEEEPCLLLTVEGDGRLSTDAGLDYSNAAPGEYVLPSPDPDAEARRIAEGARALTGARIAVVLSDTEFVPSRAIGTMDVAIGCHRVPTVRMGMGRPDRYGRRKFGGVDMRSNEIAAAAALLMGQTDEGVPVVLVRGLGLAGDGPAAGPGPGLTPEIIRGGLLRIVFSWLLVRLAPVIGAIVGLGRAPRGSTPRWARRDGSVTLSRSMSLNPRGALRPICHDHEFDPDQEEDSPSGHGLRGLSVFLGPLPEEGRQGPEAHHEQEPRVDMEVGAEVGPNPRIDRR